MAHLDLSLLGGFLARLDGQVLDGFASDKVRALLAYLAVEADRPHRRETLATLLWPERAESQARASLSQALFNLRSILGDRISSAAPSSREGTRATQPSPPVILVTGLTVQFNLACDHRVDVISFSSCLKACAAHAHRVGEDCAACLQKLSEAVSLYRGDLMQDLAIADSVPYEEWAAVRREQLHRGALEAL